MGSIVPSHLSIEISEEDIVNGGTIFEEKEGRDSMYRVAIYLLTTLWGKIPEMVDALTVLLLTWNGAFYRYGMFDQVGLEAWLQEHWDSVSALRKRQIVTFSHADETLIAELFQGLLVALQIASGTSRGKKSPVSVAKALHLLAPEFLPLWDKEIAASYGCAYTKNPSEAYLRFCHINREIAARLALFLPTNEKPLLKRIDEFNYAKFTKGWI